FDPGFDRNATRRTQKIEHLAAPQVDTRLHPKAYWAFRQRLEQLAPGQKNLVNEVDVGDAGGDQPVELDEYRGERAPAIIVAEILLGAEGAMVRATAGSLDFRARAQRCA